MAGFISKQPNGLYCRFSTVVDCITDWNMTEEDYVEMCAERGREEARDVLENYLKPFSEVVERTHPLNMKTEEIVTLFNKLGYEPTKDEIKEWKDWEEDEEIE
jgi:hypothetical protein